MKKIDIKTIALEGIVAALYVALSWLLAPISYGAIQFRISEVLILLVLFKPELFIALILGTFITNTTSPLGWYDMVFGTLATVIAVLPLLKVKNPWIAASFPVISNGIIVAIELYFALEISPIMLSVLTVGLGEAVVLYLLGVPMVLAINKNDGLLEAIGFNKLEIKEFKTINTFNICSFILAVLGVILFVACPVMDSTSMLSLVGSNMWLISSVLLPIIYCALFIISKDKYKLILPLCCMALLLIPFILLAVNYNECLKYPYYYLYVVYLLLLVFLPIFWIRREKKKCLEQI